MEAMCYLSLIVLSVELDGNRCRGCGIGGQLRRAHLLKITEPIFKTGGLGGLRIHLFLHPAGGCGGCCAGRWPCTARSRRPEGRISRSAYGGGAANARRSRRGAGRSCYRRSWACPLRVKHRSEITARRHGRGGPRAARRGRRRCAGGCRGGRCRRGARRAFCAGWCGHRCRSSSTSRSRGGSARACRRTGRSRSTGRGGGLGGSWWSGRRGRRVGRAHFSGASR